MNHYRVLYHQPNEPHPKMYPGDLVLTKRRSLLNQLVYLCQSIEVEEKYSEWTHAGIIVAESTESMSALIQESLTFGVEVEAMDKYDDREYAVVSFLETTMEDEKQMAEFSTSVRNSKGKRGYGYGTIIGVFLGLLLRSGVLAIAAIVLFGIALATMLYLVPSGFFLILVMMATVMRIEISSENTAICSGYCAEVLVRRGEIFDESLAHIMPAHLARHFGVDGTVKDPLEAQSTLIHE